MSLTMTLSVNSAQPALPPTEQPVFIAVFFVSAFGDDFEDSDRPSSLLESDPLTADWVQELPEDLDVAIAQRDFEGAVDMVERGGY